MRTQSDWMEKYGGQDDAEVALCTVCKTSQPTDDGESAADGFICNGCMREQVQCAACARSYARAEYLTPTGVDERCSDCAYARDQVQ